MRLLKRILTFERKKAQYLFEKRANLCNFAAQKEKVWIIFNRKG